MTHLLCVFITLLSTLALGTPSYSLEPDEKPNQAYQTYDKKKPMYWKERAATLPERGTLSEQLPCEPISNEELEKGVHPLNRQNKDSITKLPEHQDELTATTALLNLQHPEIPASSTGTNSQPPTIITMDVIELTLLLASKDLPHVKDLINNTPLGDRLDREMFHELQLRSISLGYLEGYKFLASICRPPYDISQMALELLATKVASFSKEHRETFDYFLRMWTYTGYRELKSLKIDASRILKIAKDNNNNEYIRLILESRLSSYLPKKEKATAASLIRRGNGEDGGPTALQKRPKTGPSI